MSRAPRVVLDTNVALSALVFAQGRVGALREAWHAARFRPLLSQATAAELMRALGYPSSNFPPKINRSCSPIICRTAA
jgi:predicted nucleic acid-binding protein